MKKTSRRILRRFALAILATTALAAQAQAQAPAAGPTMAVLSLVGDSIDVVTFQMQTGHLNEANLHEVLPFAAAGLDYAALGAAKSVLSEIQPDTDIALLAASKPESYALQNQIFDGNHVKLPPEIDAAVHREHATQLVLLTKYRGEARLNTSKGAMGTGKLAGVGFYVDGVHSMRRTDTGENAVGFIAPYAYIDLSLIDVATNTLVRRSTVTQSRTLSAARNAEGVGAWGVLSPEEKVEALKTVVDQAVHQGLPSLIRPEKKAP
jgi:hypothetical protein